MKQGNFNRRSGRLRRGHLVLEMVLAMAIAGMIGSAAVSLLSGLSAGTQIEHNTRRALIKRQVTVARLAAQLRSCARLLARDANRLVLWTNDASGDGKPNISEMRSLWWDEASDQVFIAEPAGPIDPASDTAYALTADFTALAQSLEATPMWTNSVLLKDVTAWSVRLDEASVQEAGYLLVSLTVQSDSGPDESIIGVSLRAQVDEGSEP